MWEVLIFTVFALLLGVLTWWMWQQRDLARRQAKTDAELTALGKGVRALAHDLHQTLELIIATTERARHITPGGIPEMLDGLEKAARSAASLVQTLGNGAPGEDSAVKCAKGIVYLGIILVRSSGVSVEVGEMGSFRYVGAEVDALRVLQNLLVNAVREAGRVDGGKVRVEVRDRTLRVTNPVRDPGLLDDRIYAQGVSHAGSAGMGLATSRQLAALVGWSIRHEVRGHEVCFVVEELPEAFPADRS